MPRTPERGRLPDATGIGRVGLRVADIDRVLPLYRDAIGLDVDRDAGAATLSAAGTPLVDLEEAPDRPDRGDRAGLFHFAIRVPDRAALGRVLRRLRDRGRLDGASDHRVSEALYLHDAEGNGIEVYRDRPRAEWPRSADGSVGITTEPLDLDGLAAAAAPAGDTLPAGTDMGHIHLEATALAGMEDFYVDGLGFDVQARYGDAAVFLGAGGYHHHVGVNTWNRRRSPSGDSRGLAWFEVAVPRDGIEDVLDRVAGAGHPVDRHTDGGVVHDPDGIKVRVVPREG